MDTDKPVVGPDDGPDRDSKRIVVANLIRALAPGGYLVVGPSEGIYDMLEPLQRHTTFLYRKPSGVGAPERGPVIREA